MLGQRLRREEQPALYRLAESGVVACEIDAVGLLCVEQYVFAVAAEAERLAEDAAVKLRDALEPLRAARAETVPPLPPLALLPRDVAGLGLARHAVGDDLVHRHTPELQARPVAETGLVVVYHEVDIPRRGENAVRADVS